MRHLFTGTFRDGAGHVVQSGTISVYLAGTTTAASIYTTATGATAVNSVTSDSTNGSFSFYVDNSDYDTSQLFDIALTKDGYEAQTYSSIRIFPALSYKEFTSVSSSGTGEDDLMTITIPAGTLRVNGGVRVTAAGTKIGSTGMKTLKMYFGTTNWTFGTATNDTNDWRCEALIFNAGAVNTQRITWLGSHDSTIIPPMSGYETGTEDTTAAVIVKCTGECADASDTITQTMMLIELI
ncbi:MAG: hypothetical protein PHY29_03060 [Syntrophales bacterium]|nr:hypothetical protein [Syntrophales bacterium]